MYFSAMDIYKSGKNYDNCCRTCLNEESEEMYDIFKNSTDIVNLVEMLAYTSLRVSIEDLLPKTLCSNCYQCLLSFHNFRKAALNNDTRLREYYNTRAMSTKSEHNGSILNENDHFVKSDSKKREIDKTMKYTYVGDDSTENNISIFTEAKVIKHSNNNIKHKQLLKIKNQSIYDSHTLLCTKEYNCTRCTAKFKDRKCYVQHIIKHNEDTQIPAQVEQNQRVVCDVCSISFNSIQSLSAHKKVHISKNRILQCTICNKVFKKYSHLKRHELSSAHKDNRPHKCVLCKKSYASEEMLTAHINMHNGIKNHHCPVCMRMFCHLRTLRNHIKVHTQEKPYLCPTCGKMFESSTNLNQHLKRHAGEKLFACNLCPKTFVSKGELKSHGLTHSGERSFACNQCNKTFTKRSSLEKHKFRHLGVKPHQCDVCSMKFADRNHLKRHYRIHTGEKPYRCEICDRAFTQSNDLHKHKRTHLGNNLYKCDECSQSFRLKIELRQHISDHFVSAKMRFKVAATSEQTLDENKLKPNLL